MTYGYCRVSTKHQSLHRQIDTLIGCGVNKRFIFSDKYSGKTLDRDGLKEFFNYNQTWGHFSNKRNR